MFLDTSSSKTEEKTAIIFEQSYYRLIAILHLSDFALLHLSVMEEKLLAKILKLYLFYYRLIILSKISSESEKKLAIILHCLLVQILAFRAINIFDL